jgi:putative ABC transport system permease protein
MANKIVGDKSPYGIPLTALALSVKKAEYIPIANFHITNLLRLRHQITTEDDFRIESQRDLLKTADKITTAITILLVAIASISLIVGGIGIMNIMLVSVSERTPEIGLRKAIGASPNDILIQFIIEAIILSVTGGIIGIMIGIGGNFLISMVSPLTIGISPIAISLSLGVSGSIGLFFGVFPAKEAAKLDPIVALRST